jgi:L-asparaginase
MRNQASILIIYTGGTIGMIKDPLTGSLRPFDFHDIYKTIPDLKDGGYLLDCHAFDPPIDSSNMHPSFWSELAVLIGEKYEDYDGFVILHGSDTMAYTASALSFMLENLNKPVVLTGSQLPLGMLRTDGRENLITAIEIAAAMEDETPLVPEVCIYFENKLFRGNRTSKFNAEDFEAFISENYPVLADVGVNIRFHRDRILKPNFKRLLVHREMDCSVAILKLFPGITEAVLRSVLGSPGLKGVILETFGAGNAPTAPWFLKVLKETSDSGIILFNVSQCKGGSVNMGLYETSRQLAEIGVIGGYDITTESALTKLMYLLGHGMTEERIKEILPRSIRGELTDEI